MDAVPRYKVPQPPRLVEGSEKVRYTKYDGKTKCQDCEQLIYEQLMRREAPQPSIAHAARFKRQRGHRPFRYICNEHAEMRRLEER